MSLSRPDLDARVTFLNRGSYVQFVSGAPNLSCLRSGRDKIVGHLTSYCVKRIHFLMTGDEGSNMYPVISVLFPCKHNSASTLKKWTKER